jgi:hypothetical protein
MAIGRSAALVFISSDSGEDYITVDGNEGDRYVYVAVFETWADLFHATGKT